MKIRNLPFDELNELEKELVKLHFKECLNDIYLCNHPDCKKSINDFWEIHREEDTDRGEYNEWTFGDDVKDMLMQKKFENEYRNKN